MYSYFLYWSASQFDLTMVTSQRACWRKTLKLSLELCSVNKGLYLDFLVYLDEWTCHNCMILLDTWQSVRMHLMYELKTSCLSYAESYLPVWRSADINPGLTFSLWKGLLLRGLIYEPLYWIHTKSVHFCVIQKLCAPKNVLWNMFSQSYRHYSIFQNLQWISVFICLP